MLICVVGLVCDCIVRLFGCLFGLWVLLAFGLNLGVWIVEILVWGFFCLVFCELLVTVLIVILWFVNCGFGSVVILGLVVGWSVLFVLFGFCVFFCLRLWVCWSGLMFGRLLCL